MKKVSLLELANEGKIEKTGAKPKLPILIEGVDSATLDVYRIPLKYLYYNDENGRIAVEMEKYSIKDINDPDYNNQIAKLIEKDNPQRLKDTKESIKQHGQQRFGYILDDGRIIDGNRRFTALRLIQKESKEKQYFEGVILPLSGQKKIDREKLKKLELALQMGIEERQKYDPLDNAVDIYRTISEDLMTYKTYAHNANMKPKNVENMYDTICLIRSFLNFIGAKENDYFIIKELKMYSIFLETIKDLKKYFNDKEDEISRNYAVDNFFAWLILQINQGNVGNEKLTNNARSYRKKLFQNEEFNNDVEEVVDDIQEKFHDNLVNDVKDLEKVAQISSHELEEFDNTYNRYIGEFNEDETIESFEKEIKGIINKLKEIEIDGGLTKSLTWSQLNSKQKEDLQNMIRDINILSKKIFEEYQQNE